MRTHTHCHGHGHVDALRHVDRDADAAERLVYTRLVYTRLVHTRLVHTPTFPLRTGDVAAVKKSIEQGLSVMITDDMWNILMSLSSTRKLLKAKI